MWDLFVCTNHNNSPQIKSLNLRLNRCAALHCPFLLHLCACALFTALYCTFHCTCACVCAFFSLRCCTALSLYLYLRLRPSLRHLPLGDLLQWLSLAHGSILFVRTWGTIPKTNLLCRVTQILIYPRPSPCLAVRIFVCTNLNRNGW